MMPTKELNSNVVTTIADTDLVTIPTPQGEIQNIAFANFMKAVRANIQVGGRNLLKGSMASMQGQSNQGYSFDGTVHSIIMKSGGMGMYKEAGDFPAGTYAISVELKADAPISVNWYLNNLESVKASFAVSTEWQRFTYVLKTSQQKLLFRLTSNDFSTRYYARFPKIEAGDIPTGFSLAPEDIISKWGGVIGLLPITYNSAEKGGAHDAYRGADRCAVSGADCHLAFGSLDALAQFCGRACGSFDTEMSGVWSDIRRGSKRSDVDMYKMYNGSSDKQTFIRFKRRLCNSPCGVDAYSDNIRILQPQNCHEEIHKQQLEYLANSEFYIISRKEVAYVAD